MNETTYRQCVLVKDGVQQVAWIPAQFAIYRNVIQLKADGQWSDGWMVWEVWPQSVPERQLPDSHLERKAHKRATGDVS